MLKRLLFVFALVSALAAIGLPAARAADNALTDAEKAEGWRLLFDGKSLEGWVATGCKEGWAVEDGTITCLSQRGGYLRTAEQFGNFVLSLEFKIAARANSGIRLRSVDPHNAMTRGLEIQIMDSAAKKTPGRGDCGSLYDCVAPAKNACRPAGEWNTLVITCDGARITVEHNGEKIVEADLNRWTTARENPDGTRNKFPVAARDMARKGYLAIQEHGGRLWFRNMKIRPL